MTLPIINTIEDLGAKRCYVTKIDFFILTLFHRFSNLLFPTAMVFCALMYALVRNGNAMVLCSIPFSIFEMKRCYVPVVFRAHIEMQMLIILSLVVMHRCVIYSGKLDQLKLASKKLRFNFTQKQVHAT